MTTLHKRIENALGTDSPPVTTLLDWSRWQLEAADVGIRLHDQTKPFGDNNFLEIRFHAIEFAALNLVFRSVTSALDLCAAILFRIEFGPPPKEREFDLDDWFEDRGTKYLPELPPDQRQWLETTHKADRWKILRECRHGITHRTISRDLVVIVGPNSTSKTKVNILDKPHDIDVLMPRLLKFGDERRSAFLTLLETTF